MSRRPDDARRPISESGQLSGSSAQPAARPRAPVRDGRLRGSAAGWCGGRRWFPRLGGASSRGRGGVWAAGPAMARTGSTKRDRRTLRTADTSTAGATRARRLDDPTLTELAGRRRHRPRRDRPARDRTRVCDRDQDTHLRVPRSRSNYSDRPISSPPPRSLVPAQRAADSLPRRRPWHRATGSRRHGPLSRPSRPSAVAAGWDYNEASVPSMSDPRGAFCTAVSIS